MTDSLRAQIERHEGRRLKPYTDIVGKVTIGVGRNLTDVGINDEECDLFLDADLAKAEHSARMYAWYEALNEPRRAVIVDMIFQMGTYGFSLFVDAIKALENGNFAGAATAMLRSRWARQTNARATELSTQMSTGQWQTGN